MFKSWAELIGKIIYVLNIHIICWKAYSSIGLFFLKRSDQLLSYLGFQNFRKFTNLFKLGLHSYFGYYEGGPIVWEN